MADLSNTVSAFHAGGAELHVEQGSVGEISLVNGGNRPDNCCGAVFIHLLNRRNTVGKGNSSAAPVRGGTCHHAEHNVSRNREEACGIIASWPGERGDCLGVLLCCSLPMSTSGRRCLVGALVFIYCCSSS